MNENLDRPNASLKKLVDHLNALDSQGGPTLEMERDMLSLIVSGALSGEDISRRYPAFYRKLLGNAELRQAFLDAIESVEAEHAGQLLPLPEGAKAGLDFLKSTPSRPCNRNSPAAKLARDLAKNIGPTCDVILSGRSCVSR